ncbi:CapA family protein [Streptomyces sp. HNM0663]|uniref:CapA family protein n=1 Tax=Streptomyces chengmaiensis TaxID=3040919 RepID=A0ABT6HXE8_9ACTN|nr:CapA family protein [Streptomyces chengmaiensis]MDH2392524.1 CapA family protein [Streptomyces chengmaiensis]
MAKGLVRLFLCGDVMLGRGVDQILPHPGDPELHEPYMDDARAYVGLAERANGPIPCPVGFTWPWGEALDVLDAAGVDVRIVNLETSVTTSDTFAPGKGIHYRMHPANLPSLAAARPDVCVLANNHVLDFGRSGLAQTLASLEGAGLATAGAGRALGAAQKPAVAPYGSGERAGRVLVFSFAMPTSGVPSGWAAGQDRSGVDWVAEPSQDAAAEIADRVRRARRPGDVTVASVHWGPNWGYRVAREEVRFAHALLDGGVDIVHGHSSHHPRPVEAYGRGLVLYGCGDLVDDYEGISGHDAYRDDLRLLYLVSVDAAAPDGAVVREVRMVPLQARRMRLEHASREDGAWLRTVLDRVSRPFGSHVELTPEGVLALSGERPDRPDAYA